MDGVAGVYCPDSDELVEMIFLATGSLQHRGKASAGIAIGNGKGIYIHKALGRIGEVIDPDIMRAFQDLEPVAAIGNVGYTKNKIPEQRNAEPIMIHPKSSSPVQIALTLDGYLVREDDLKAELEDDYYFNTGNKTEVVGALLHKYISEQGITFEAGKELVDKLHGKATFAITALVYDGKETHLITLNDDRAFEPFCYGTIDDCFVVSSESASHRRLASKIEGEFEGAEMTISSSKGTETRRLREEIIIPDIFQGVYFGNVISLFRGKEIFQLRKELGHGSVDHYGSSDITRFTPNPESGWGFSIGIFEQTLKHLEKKAFDYSRFENEKLIFVKDLGAYEQLQKLTTIYPALVKQAQAVRTFQESERRKRATEVGLKFGAIDSLLYDQTVGMGDDSIVKGSVSEGGSVWAIFNAGASSLEFWISYPPMLFPSFKEWHRGEECMHELAAQKAYTDGETPYDKNVDDINDAVSAMISRKLAKKGIKGANIRVKYNTREIVEKIAGPGSYQALDASYPISEEYWPRFIKEAVKKYHASKR